MRSRLVASAIMLVVLRLPSSGTATSCSIQVHCSFSLATKPLARRGSGGGAGDRFGSGVPRPYPCM